MGATHNLGPKLWIYRESVYGASCLEALDDSTSEFGILALIQVPSVQVDLPFILKNQGLVRSLGSQV